MESCAEGFFCLEEQIKKKKKKGVGGGDERVQAETEPTFLREYGFGAGIPALRFDWGFGLVSVYL